jgi:hypothetical protein
MSRSPVRVSEPPRPRTQATAARLAPPARRKVPYTECGTVRTHRSHPYARGSLTGRPPLPLRYTMRAPGSLPVARLVWTKRKRVAGCRWRARFRSRAAAPTSAGRLPQPDCLDLSGAYADLGTGFTTNRGALQLGHRHDDVVGINRPEGLEPLRGGQGRQGDARSRPDRGRRRAGARLAQEPRHRTREDPRAARARAAARRRGRHRPGRRLPAPRDRRRRARPLGGRDRLPR